MPDKSELNSDSEQKRARKPRKQTSDKEKLDKLYKKVEKSVSTGQGSLSQYIEKVKELGLLPSPLGSWWLVSDWKQEKRTNGEIANVSLPVLPEPACSGETLGKNCPRVQQAGHGKQ